MRRNGGYTPHEVYERDTDKWIASWKEAAAPLCEALGLNLVGFDPEFHFVRRQSAAAMVTLPCWFVVAYNEAHAKREEAK